ncbi:ParB N-terminal domain-containing protein [Aeoliella mucimassa]|uniref:ParB-like nuclease domain protein n=1 Tax=Aeoliella mucimassa TaxID=2527972 RepID=A0A518AHX6_9BACT|nr:ParB N-terminal domain-containing protein [Aeoliella mucimassa]QDU54315.1 ParB-like nuclease domain protein [Aeoliella mucimassa]
MHIIDRVKELRRVPASELKPNPRNWRIHPAQQQDALRGVLADVGFADAVVARELPDGTLELVDGHLRAETMGDALVPVLVVDLDDQQATKVLLTHDALAEMATVDRTNFTSLMGDVTFEHDSVIAMLEKLEAETPSPTTEDHRPEVEIPELYQVVAECENELEQQSLYERLRDEGYKCRVLSL